MYIYIYIYHQLKMCHGQVRIYGPWSSHAHDMPREWDQWIDDQQGRGLFDPTFGHGTWHMAETTKLWKRCLQITPNHHLWKK